MKKKLKDFAIKVKKKPKDLYHLSFNSKLEGTWIPKSPEGDYEPTDDESLLPEITDPRISLSPTIRQCFQAIYSNIKHLYGKKEKQIITFQVYKPVFKGNESIVFPDVLTKEKMVHDAHITEEHCIVTPVYMKHIGTVEINKPNPNKKLYYYAYDIETKDGYYGWVPFDVNVVNYSLEKWYIL